jgi:hypothetical protein
VIELIGGHMTESVRGSQRTIQDRATVLYYESWRKRMHEKIK